MNKVERAFTIGKEKWITDQVSEDFHNLCYVNFSIKVD